MQTCQDLLGHLARTGPSLTRVIFPSQDLGRTDKESTEWSLQGQGWAVSQTRIALFKVICWEMFQVAFTVGGGGGPGSWATGIAERLSDFSEPGLKAGLSGTTVAS